MIGIWHVSYQAPLNAGHIVSNLLLIQSWGIGQSIDPPGWSISTEVFAYLLFPALASFLLFGRLRTALIGTVISVSVLLIVATRSGATLHETGIRPGPLAVWIGSTLYPLISCVAGFSLGLLVWRFLRIPFVWRAGADFKTGTITVAATIGLLCFHGSDVLTVIALALLILTLATEKSPANYVLSSPPIYWLGLISYSIYLVHWPILDAAQVRLQSTLDHGRTGLLAPSTLIITLAAIITGAAFHYLVERPGREWSRRLLSHGSTSKVKSKARESSPLQAAASSNSPR